MLTTRAFAGISVVLLAAACAHRAATATATAADCDRISGAYTIDPASCRDSRGLLQLSVNTARLPDESIIEPAVVGIHQEGCESLSFVFRDRRGFEAQVRPENGALVHTTREWSNLPPPVAVGAHGDWSWSLRRKPGSDDLLYTFAYAERGFFFLIPYNAHRETTCTFTRQR